MTNPISAAILVQSTVFATKLSVLKFDRSMRPQWLYHLPRTPLNFNDVKLVADGANSQLYLVDMLNGYVTALQR